MKYYLGIDNGGTTTKAVLFDIDGKEIYSASRKTPLIVPKEGYNERSMEELWTITKFVIKTCIEHINSNDIIAVACTGHGKGIYLWGYNDKPSYNAITSTDHRAKEIVRRWYVDGTNERAKEKTLQNVIECQPVALIRWLKETNPKVLENTKWIFEAKDYIRFMLTGEAYAEITDYSGTCLMNLLTSDFDKELLKIFGIEEVFDKLPPMRYSCDVCGYITQETSNETGLPKGIPVCGGMFDIDACAIAMGAHKDDDICVITGTWAINEYVSSTYHKGEARNSLFCIPGKYLIEESSPASAGNLEWVIANFMKEELQNSKNNNLSVYDYISKMVHSLHPQDSDIIFLPFLYGSNAENIERACLFGMTNSHDKRDVARAVYEGVVYCHMNHIERLLEGRGKPRYLKLAGGVTKSKVWSQMFADISGIPVKIIEANELGGLGCAIACAVASGECSNLDEAVNRMVRIRKIYQPNATMTKIYQKKYVRYNQLVKCLSMMG